MPQPKKAARFGGTPAHHNLILANLTTELMRHGRIRTTVAKAKSVQPLAERMITFAKRGDVHSRRQVLKVIRDKDVVHKLFADVGPAFAGRDGGYTRVLKLGPRKGDAAPMALIELVEGVGGEGGEAALDEAPRRRWSLRRRRGGTVSASARARQEDRLAAADRGEDLLAPEADEDEPDTAATSATGQEVPGLDAGEVDARLAAEDEVEAGPVPTAEQEAPAEERVPDADSPSLDTPASGAEEAPEAGPVPAAEQEAPAEERVPDEDTKD